MSFRKLKRDLEDWIGDTIDSAVLIAAAVVVMLFMLVIGDRK